MELLEIFSKEREEVEIIKTEGKIAFPEGHSFTREEMAFYEKFSKAVDEARAIERGDLEGIPLDETINEI